MEGWMEMWRGGCKDECGEWMDGWEGWWMDGFSVSLNFRKFYNGYTFSMVNFANLLPLFFVFFLMDQHLWNVQVHKRFS